MKMIKLMVILTVTAIALSCSSDKTEDPPKTGTEKSAYSIVIDPGAATRAADDTQTPSAEESKFNIGDGLKVYVFNLDGSLDYTSETDVNAVSGRLPLTDLTNGKYATTKFEVTAGDKYFYVFANDGTTGGEVNAPLSTMPMNEFMAQTIAVTFDADDVPSIAGDGFLMGTLWREKKLAISGGTDTDPVTVSLVIGRMISKVNLAEVDGDNVSNTDLKGKFTDPKYRMGSIPKRINTAGVHTGDLVPVVNVGVLVESSVHTAVPLNPLGDANYVRYTNKWKEEDESFYTTENTTAKDASGLQYFGNTTYIQLETVYEPDPAEIYEPAGLTPGQTLMGGTFWTARIKSEPTAPNAALAGKIIILNADPATAGTVHQDIETAASYPQYTDGKNYHKFAVFDKGENDAETRNRVLRNHYYEFKVTEFLDLGSHDPEVDPKEPIPDITTITVEVTVKDWDKVTGTTPVG